MNHTIDSLLARPTFNQLLLGACMHELPEVGEHELPAEGQHGLPDLGQHEVPDVGLGQHKLPAVD